MKIRISEYFTSVQGEGISAGVPSLFIRFAGCNLLCGGHMGSLVKEGKATWWCDTETVWMRAREIDTEEIVSSLTPAQMEAMRRRRFRIVFTGGEPCTERNTDYAFAVQMAFWQAGVDPFFEVETNGTVQSGLLKNVDQINCSPKLSNSGLPRAMRIKPDVLHYINDVGGDHVQFKFVVSNEGDLEEVIRDFVIAVQIPEEKIVLMPAVDSRKDLAETTRFVWEQAARLGWRMCSRLHILCYDKVTGV